MLGTNDLYNGAVTAMAADELGVGGGVDLEMHLVGVPFTPSGDMTLSNFPPPVFTGAAAIKAAIGVTKIIKDELTGESGFLIPEPAGGFNWVATATPTEPVLVYGLILYNRTATTVLASANFADGPKTIARSGDFIEASAMIGLVGQPIME